MSRIVHFEMTVSDIDRASAFYKKAFGWKVEKWDGPFDYWFATTGEEGPGINGAFVKQENEDPKTINIVGVKSIEEVVKKVEKEGGKVLAPKTLIPGVGYVAYCEDTEGNPFGLYVDDMDAK